MPKHPSSPSQSQSHSLSPPALDQQQSYPHFEFASNSHSNFRNGSQYPQQHEDNSYSPSQTTSASRSGLNSTSRHDADTATATGSKNVDTRTGKRRYAASCEACRRRKRRCDGKGENGESLCKFCPQAGIACVFPRSGEASRLESAITTAEASQSFIEQLASAGDDDRERMLMEWMKQRDDGEVKKPIVSTRKRRKLVKKEEVEEDKLAEGNSLPEPSAESTKTSNIITVFDRAADEDSSVKETAALRQDVLNRLLAVAVDSFSEFRIPTLAESQLMMESYFCWQNPRYEVIYRPAFEESLHTSEPTFCNDFLLWCIYSQASRHIPEMRDRLHEFAARAHLLLAVELSRPSAIATVQGVGHGRRYAFRMIEDLGWERPNRSYEGLPEKLRTAELCTYWAAYTWDKTLSLSLAKRPTLRPKEKPPLPPVEDGATLWRPFYSEVQWAEFTTKQYPGAQASFEMRCFRYSCSLYQFLDEVLEHVYSIKESRLLQARDFVLSMRDRMTAWQAQVPVEILLDADNLPPVSPPAHVIQFNLLIHTIWILLYRPFAQTGSLAVPYAATACRKSAQDIAACLRLFKNSFPVARSAYLFVYAALCSATIDMGDIISASQSQAVVGGEKDGAKGSAKKGTRRVKGRSDGRWGGKRAEKATERLETTLPILAHGIRLKIPGAPKMVGALMQMLESANALQQQEEPDADEIRLQPPPMAPAPSHASVAGPSHAPAMGPRRSVVEYTSSAAALPSVHAAPAPIPPYLGGALPPSRMHSKSADATPYGGIPAGTNVYQHQPPPEQGIPRPPLPASTTFLDEFFSSFMPMDTSADSHPMSASTSFSAWPSAGGLDFFALPNPLPSPSNSDHLSSTSAPQIVPGHPILTPQEQIRVHNNQKRQFPMGTETVGGGKGRVRAHTGEEVVGSGEYGAHHCSTSPCNILYQY
ncbi:uncharacterized protein STEHIDRAFT_163363 [Stereum hirsutum FP-91666 SS1]|uniref:Zn(2)-C6 fungal-type domain-containing protein n=1 Tax=Stereum hirsutum (strain FP-91666) TaxID=721885 RepID=R7RWV1_STEHR|nr:uncharacterized protein STEHIDRAFT_163363 [Stereum hirsutum FP-91666 SS1]EIM79804.1 hypothetical protein STEHIDRAFT_163363 [Stereum hirsutum FP-91666 SS1]